MGSVYTVNTLDRYIETVKPPCDLKNKQAVSRYVRLAEAVSQLHIIRRAFETEQSMQNLFQGESIVKGRGFRRYNVFGECSEDNRFVVEITRIVNGHVVTQSPPLNGADFREQRNEENYQIVLTERGFTFRACDLNNENPVQNIQTLVEMENIQGSGHNALSAVINSAQAVSRHLLTRI